MTPVFIKSPPSGTPQFVSNARPLSLSFPVLLFMLTLLGACPQGEAQNYNGLGDQIPASEYVALVDLYNRTGGANWWSHEGWLDPAATSWHGVTISGVELDGDGNITTVGYVSQIDLNNNRLRGEVPESLGNLTKLERLNLNNNQLSGNIPASLSNLAKLETLDFGFNQMSGNIPGSVGSLANLQHLNLGFNQLNGSIPASFGNLANLRHLNLSFNQLSGSIPAGFGNLVNFETIDLGDNQLSGSVPASFGNLVNLLYLDLRRNQLSGSIPASFGNLANLLYLDLHRNQLSGSMPASIGNVDVFYYLDLSANQLSGSIPASVGSLANLHYLNLSFNQLSNSIPSSFGNLANLERLNLSVNQLRGNIPASLGSLGKLLELNLGGNQLSGNIPETFGNLASLYRLDLGGTQLSGSIPEALGNLTRLEELNLSNNRLSGKVPVSLGNLVNLYYWLDLGGNQLSGSIPESLGNLIKLHRIDLHGNQLSGSIPESLSNLLSLNELYLNRNQLNGGIPGSLSNLANLQFLGLDNNELSGSIPCGLSNLSNLAYLSLNNNQLSGSLPECLVGLENLRLLYLDHNLITGNIPTNFASLRQLQILTLAFNRLIGPIPYLNSTVGRLHADLSYNWLDVAPGTSSRANLDLMTAEGQGVDYLPQGLGLDISVYSGELAREDFEGIRQQGHFYVIVQGWGGATGNRYAESQLGGARAAGLLTAGYCLLNFNNAYDGARQVRNALLSFGGEAAHLGFLAIDIEVGKEGWNLSPGLRHSPYNELEQARAVELIDSAVNQVISSGLKPVIYTRQTHWNQITGKSERFNALPLWDVYMLEVNPLAGNNLYLPDLSAPAKTFGGWTSRVGKQFFLDTRLKSPLDLFPVDLNVFSPNAFALANSNYKPLSLFLRIEASSTKPIISWNDSTLILEETTDLDEPWTPVPNATSPFTPPRSGANRFYRLR